jgi:hypothetical protein
MSHSPHLGREGKLADLSSSERKELSFEMLEKKIEMLLIIVENSLLPPYTQEKQKGSKPLIKQQQPTR